MSFLITEVASLAGNFAVERLLNFGQKVRALVERKDSRWERLRDLGAEIVVGQYDDPSALGEALRGVRRACFASPNDEGLLERTELFAQLAEEAGVEMVVNVSEVTARAHSIGANAIGECARARWFSESIFDRSGLAVAHVRSTLSADFLLHIAPMIRDGRILTPFGKGRHAPLAPEDLAQAVVRILASPDGHEGRTYSVHGPEALSFEEIAEIVSVVVGKRIEYEQVDVEFFNEIVDAENNPSMRLCSDLIFDHTQGLFAQINQSFKEITGQDPLTLANFLRKYRYLFS